MELQLEAPLKLTRAWTMLDFKKTDEYLTDGQFLLKQIKQNETKTAIKMDSLQTLVIISLILYEKEVLISYLMWAQNWSIDQENNPQMNGSWQ